jgi:ABC-2 type transport system ATP-binding protein
MTVWALETRGLTKVFNGEKAVDDCSLQVAQGSVFGLIGPNGAGKTTLIKMLMGVHLPTAGNGQMLGKEIPDTTGEVRQEIGYVADTQQMYPHFKVEEILQFCSMVYRNWDRQRCQALLKGFELPQGKLVRSLSKGMKTQLGLIIALSVRPRLLILDEPAGGLDPVLRHHFMQLIMQETAREGTTVFFSTHNLYDLERAAEQVAVIMKGKILFSKPLDQLKSSSRKIQAVFPKGMPEEARNIPGVLRIEEQGRIYSFITGSDFEGVWERVQGFNPVYLEVMDLDLEDVFINVMAKEGYTHEGLFLE